MHFCVVWAYLATLIFSAVAHESCSEGLWQCLDGACIYEEDKCNGKKDCPDSSDETHALCRNTFCPESRFRCQYGACLDSTVFCDGQRDCFDGSDEIPRRCRNETLIKNGKFACTIGTWPIDAEKICDGRSDCQDGSDENINTCAGMRCPRGSFQCAYGACVDGSAKCDDDRRWDCADRSDEDYVLCGKPLYNPLNILIPSEHPKQSPPTETHTACGKDQWTCKSGSCIALSGLCDGNHDCRDYSDEAIRTCLKYRDPRRCYVPVDPEHGMFNVSNEVWHSSGYGHQSFTLNLYCDPHYITYTPETSCFEGTWDSPPSTCEKACMVPLRHPSITYNCGDKECVEFIAVPKNTTIHPQCKNKYHYDVYLKDMKCIDGNWDYIPTCVPEVHVIKEGNKMTLYIGNDNLVVHLDGSKYTIELAYDSKSILKESVQYESTTEPMSTTTVTTETEEPKRLHPAFHHKYDPIAYQDKNKKKD